jgi:choline dehydrogenase-like flavoprotein
MLGQVEQSRHLSDKISRRLYPDAGADMTSTAQMKDAVREIAMSEYHPCGSVAMGAATDTKLVVKGTENIRCVDASIFPNRELFFVFFCFFFFGDFVSKWLGFYAFYADGGGLRLDVSGNIVSSVYAAAEKAADLIKEDWLYGALKAAA